MWGLCEILGHQSHFQAAKEETASPLSCRFPHDMLNFPVVLLTNYFLSCLSQARSLKAALSTLDVICALQTTETHAMLQKSQAQQKYQLLNPHPPPDEEDHGKRILEIGSDLEISPDQFLDWSYNAVTRQDFPPLGRGVDT